MRIQILPLTPMTVGDYTTTPFVLVLDSMSEEMTTEQVEGARQTVGAAAVIVVNGEEQAHVVPPLEFDDEARATLAHAIATLKPDEG